MLAHGIKYCEQAITIILIRKEGKQCLMIVVSSYGGYNVLKDMGIDDLQIIVPNDDLDHCLKAWQLSRATVWRRQSTPKGEVATICIEKKSARETLKEKQSGNSLNIR